MEKTSSKFYVKFNKVLRLKAEFRRNKEKVKCLRKKLDCPVKPGNDTAVEIFILDILKLKDGKYTIYLHGEGMP